METIVTDYNGKLTVEICENKYFKNCMTFSIWFDKPDTILMHYILGKDIVSIEEKQYYFCIDGYCISKRILLTEQIKILRGYLTDF